MKLLIDPELLLPASHDQAPMALIRRGYEVVKASFGYFSADPASGPECRRCGRLLHLHAWQATYDNGDILDCEVTR